MLPASHPVFRLPAYQQALQAQQSSLAAAPPPTDAPGTETDPVSSLARIGGGVVGGISAIGNLLDLPGSMVRDTIGGHNPFDQILTPFSDTNRTSGRQLLREYNLAGQKDTWGNFFGGMGTEIALDPFTYPLRWLGMATKAGAARTARLAATGKPALDATTLGGAALDLARQAVPQTWTKAAANSKGGKAFLRATDRLGREWNKHFDASVMGRSSKEGQAAARRLFAARLAADQETGALTLPVASQLSKQGLLTEEVGKAQRSLLEGVVPEGFDNLVDSMGHPLDPKTADMGLGHLDRLKTELDADRQTLRTLGRHQEDLDDVVDYFPRGMNKDLRAAIAKRNEPASPLSAVNAADTGRDEWLKGFQKGSNHVDEVLTDPEWEGILDKASSEQEAVDQIRDQLAEKYGADILPTYTASNEEGKLRFVDETGKDHPVSRGDFKKFSVENPDGTFTYTRKTDFGRGEDKVRTLTPVLADRYEEIARKIVRNPEMRQMGGFGNHPVFDADAAIRGKKHQIAALQTSYDLLATPGVLEGRKPPFPAGEARPTTVGDILQEMRVDADDGSRVLAERLGVAVPEKGAGKFLENFRKQVVRDDVARDLLDSWKGTELSQELGKVDKGIQSFSSLFKAGVLTWPARYVRDAFSGQVRNFENRMFDSRSLVQAHQLLQGQAVDGLEKIPSVTEWLQRTGRETTAENASDAVREMYAAFKASPDFQNTDLPNGPRGLQGVQDLLNQIPGQKKAWDLGEIGRTFIGRGENGSLNPMNVRGNAFSPLAPLRDDAAEFLGDMRQETTFGPAAAGDLVGKYTDDTNRLTPFLNLLKKGEDPAKAMQKIQFAQVDYHPRNFTKTEQQLKKIFPFYSFFSKQIPYLTKTLLDQPAGRLGQVIRAQRLSQSQEEGTPDYIAGTTSIPLGELPDGSSRYLTGFGLMHEDTPSFLTFRGNGLFPSVQDMLAETISRMNPVLKGAIETAAGESFFQRSPMGGRDLRDMDPTLGRTVSNLSQMFGGPAWQDASGRAHPLLHSGFEQIVANSPLSRLTTTVRQATDPRKNVATRAVNLLTGVRLSDVSPAAREGVLREEINAYARDYLGAKVYEKVYFNKETIAQEEKNNPEQAAAMRQVNRLGQVLKKRREQRQKEAAKN